MMEELNESLVLKKSGEEKLAHFVSFLFHPLLMPTYGFGILFFTDNYISVFTTPVLKIVLLAITFVFTFLFPFINAFVLLKMGRIKSLSMENTEERYLPYAGTIFYYFSLYYLFYNTELPSLFKVLVLGASLSVLFTFLINFKWKISAHTTGIGGITGILLAIIYRWQQSNMYFVLALVLAIAGIIGFARLKLKAHTPTQVYVGFLLGFLINFLLIVFY